MPSLKNLSIKPNGTIVVALSAVAVVWLLYAINSRQRETVNELRDLRLTITKAARQVAEAQNPDIQRKPETPSPEVDAEVVAVGDTKDEAANGTVEEAVDAVEADPMEVADEVSPDGDDDTPDAPEPNVPTPEAAEGN